MGDSFIKNKKIFSSNDHRKLFQKNGPSSKHQINKNQFRPGGKGDIYKKEKSKYHSSNNIYQNLASNSYPKNLNNHYKIKPIDPFANNEKRGRVESVTAPHYLTPQINSKKQITSRESKPSNPHHFQLTTSPYNNVYQNKK
jgi:hypothetical protein